MLFKRKARKDAKSRSGGSEFWHCRIVVGGKLYQFSTGTKDKNKARSIEAAFRTEKIKHRLDPLSAPTLSEFGARFINDGIVGRVSRWTFHYYAFNWSVLDDSPLSSIPLDRIDAVAVDRFVSWRRKKGKVSVVTVNHNLRTLRRALHLAADWNLIAKPPKIRMLPGERQREYVLSDDDVKKFEKEKSLIGRLVPFLVDTGLRRGELCNLLWRNVNTAGTEIHITKGKTKFSRRRIPLTARAAKILTELPRNGEHVFTDKYGHGITLDWISHAFLAVRKKLELPSDCVLHSTRHTFCTRLGEAGADAFAIQRLAGHSSITISQRYVHPTASRIDATIALLDKRGS